MERPSSLGNLGVVLRIRYDRKGDKADLEESTCHFEEAYSLLTIGYTDQSDPIDNLNNVSPLKMPSDQGTALMAEAQLQGSSGGEISSRSSTGEQHSNGPSTRDQANPDSGASDALGAQQEAWKACQDAATRFAVSKRDEDLDACTRSCKSALAVFPKDHPHRLNALRLVGMAFAVKFNQEGDIADLEQCIYYQQECLLVCPVGHPDRPSILNNLGVKFNIRSNQTGNAEDLEQSIRHHQEALTLCPIGHPERIKSLNDLSDGLNTRFGRTGSMADLDQSICYQQEALTLCPIGHQDHASILTNLGNRLYIRFQQTGHVADLEESIRHNQEALILRPIGHPERVLIPNPAVGLDIRFGWTGNVTNLEESIGHLQEALTLCPIGHPHRASTLNNLGGRLDTRFERAGNMADLEESIRHHQEALTLRPVGHPERASTLNNLGNRLDSWFERTGDLTYLEESIHHHQEALTLCPIGHPHRASTLNNIGVVLETRFEQTGNITDLETSIQNYREALTLRPTGHPDRASSLNNLGFGLDKRFGRTENMTDLEESIRLHQEALALRPIGHPDRAISLDGLGNVFYTRFGRTANIADLEESIQHYTDAAGQTLSPLSHRLTAAHNWILVARRNGLESLEAAYSTYMDLLDRSLLLSASSIPATHAQIAYTYKDGINVTEEATSHAVKKHRFSEAVEIAERGRALLFTQLGNYRTLLDDLEGLNKSLADRFRDLSAALENPATSSLDAMNAQFAVGDQVARRQRIASDWDHTVKEIRQLDGFKDFLSVTPFINLKQAAADGPVILINISHNDSYALIITTTTAPLPVPLPEAKLDPVVVLAFRLFDRTRGDADETKSNQILVEILRDLWAMIVSPIVLQLEVQLGLSIGSRIWWMPTSWAWWLPLHAAGPYKSGELNLLDRFVSSYTITLSSLIRSRTGYEPAKRASGPRMLVIAQAEAEGQDPLRYVEAEVALIRQMGTEVMIIEGEDCTRDAVLAGLKDMAWAHFSCHGHQHPVEPFKSHFSLRTADAPLTLLDIIHNDLPQAELAVLSTCHSASADLSTPSESINLVTGMMFAGFRSAVGTMWAMDDQDGPVVSEYFYKYMFRNGLDVVDCRDAAKAMVMGIRELRRRKVPLARWVNFIHYGI
ncbi:hypothetical protein FRB95_002293 [Tulasnella sp. JGI-2019a]|nr:hypothetical protein FRB95_002293 [Tulasnella sp. JGI-2019a]